MTCMVIRLILTELTKNHKGKPKELSCLRVGNIQWAIRSQRGLKVTRMNMLMNLSVPNIVLRIIIPLTRIIQIQAISSSLIAMFLKLTSKQAKIRLIKISEMKT